MTGANGICEMSEDGEHILVVEDDAFSRKVLIQQLAKERCGRIVEAENGYQAMDILRSCNVDLVLLDIQMPELDGIAVLRQLKSDPDLRPVPVIVISGVEDISSVVECIELGAEDYLSKPFNPVILRARISASLEKRRLRKAEASHLARIVHERKRSDDLLHVILPWAAAQELKTTGMVESRRHDCVAVLFCDIVGFTSYCERHPAENVIARLQALIERFEEITERHEMEKIKTIGDSFMATAGMLSVTDNPSLSTVRCGLDMIAETPTVAPGWEVRVGVDCGPLVSGVLGRQKYQFDVWGSVVNVASRMTEFASPGAVAMTRETWNRLGGHFAGRCLGQVEVKGLGKREIVECRLDAQGVDGSVEQTVRGR